MRRRHPLQVGWRRFRSIKDAIRHAVFLTVGTGALLTGAIFGAALTQDFLVAIGTSWSRLHEDVLTGRVSRWRVPHWMHGSGEPFSPVMVAVFSMLGGLTLAFGLPHWRKWMLVPLWVGLWNVVVFTPQATHEIGLLIDRACVRFFSESAVVVPTGSGPDFKGAYELATASVYSIVPLCIGTMGGSIATRLASVNARRRWIKRRRMLKRRRESR